MQPNVEEVWPWRVRLALVQAQRVSQGALQLFSSKLAPSLLAPVFSMPSQVSAVQQQCKTRTSLWWPETRVTRNTKEPTKEQEQLHQFLGWLRSDTASGSSQTTVCPQEEHGQSICGKAAKCSTALGRAIMVDVPSRVLNATNHRLPWL